MKSTGTFITTHLLILLVVILGSMSLQAQYYSKRSVLFGGSSNGFISSIQVMNDTVYAMCGVTDTTPPYRSLGTFNIYDKNGNIVSKQKFDIPIQRNLGCVRNCLIRTHDNGFMYGGYCNTDSDHSVLIVKFDRTGNQQWYKTYSDSGKYLTLYVNAFIRDSFSNYYFVGNVTHPLNSDNDILVGKIDSSGNLIFFKVFNDPTLNDDGLSVSMNSLNNIIITGECGRMSTQSGVYHKFYEIDSNGNVLRYSLGTDTSGPSIFAMTPCMNGNYLMVGGSLCQGGYTNGFYKGNISSYDSNFNKIWSIDLGPCGGYNTQFWALTLLPDSNYLAIGKWYNPTDTSHYDQYGWLVKFTQSGTVLWERKYRGVYNPLTYGDQSQLLSVSLFSDSTLIIAGEATDLSAQQNSQQGWLLHLDTAGCLPDSNSCGIVAGVTEVRPAPEWEMNLYPNPAANLFTLDYQVSTMVDVGYFIITDVLGREVYKEKLGNVEGSISISTSAWGNSLYYCTLIDETGFRLSKPISVLH